MRGASSIATDTAGIVLMDGRLKQLNRLFDLAHDLDKNLETSFLISFVPGLIGMGGVFFFHWGIVSTVILYNMAVASSALNGMFPLLKHHQPESSKLAR